MIDRSNLRILVVDDFLNMRLMVKNMLRQLGFGDIDLAANGADAIPMLRARRHRLVISDWNMEPVSGLQLLEAVLDDPALGAPLFVMITGSREAASQADELGAIATIVKPFSLIDMKEAMTRVLMRGGPLQLSA
jgi:two-component system chemotaxis response regulator CheY